MFEFRAYPAFSWSNSRHKTFLDCQRKYYYQYYQAHNGWQYEAPEENRSAYRLKNIKNIPILLGEEVHKAIDFQLKNFLSEKRLITEHEMISGVIKKLNHAYLDSTKRQQYWHNQPNRFRMLYEIYYGNGLSQEEIASAKSRLEVCVKNFFTSKTFQDVETRLEMKVLKSEDFQTFEVNGVDVFVVLDFVYMDVSEGKWIVVDWKTGKESEDDRKQLALYTLFLNRVHGIPLKDIVIRNEYLLSGTSKEYRLTEFDLDSTQEIMNESIYHMLKVVEDPVLNKPFAIDRFEMKQSNRCFYCNFKEKCS